MAITYYHVNEGKLVPRAKKGYFVGYPAGRKAYKIWCQEDKKCIINRYVKFQETKMYKGSRNTQEQVTDKQELESFELEVEHKTNKDTPPEASQTTEP